MNIILALVSRDESIVENSVSQFERFVQDEVTFKGSRQVSRRESCIVMSYSANNPIFGKETFCSLEGSSTVFTGVPLINVGRKYAVREIDSKLTELGAAGFRESVGGTYSIMRIKNDEVLCFTDICGRCPLFYKKVVGGYAVANSPLLLSSVGGDGDTSSWNLSGRAAESLLVHSQIWGDSLLYPGVKLLEPRFGLSCTTDGERFFEISPSVWREYGGEFAKGPKQWSEASDALQDSFKAVSYLTGGKQVTLGLSGGKDSRVMAAYSVACGVNPHFFTSGIKGSPEFGVAKSVAKELGSHTEIRESDPLNVQKGASLEGFKHHVGRYDGMLLPVAGSRSSHKGSVQVEVTGFGGELYRGGISKQFVNRSLVNWEDAATRWRNYHVPQDALGVVSARTRDRDGRWMADWVSFMRESGMPLQALPELFFSQYRVPLHQGLASVASGAKLSIDPLIHPKIHAVHNSFGQFAGSTEMTHASLLWTVNPRLLSIPFLKDSWSAKLLPKFKGFELAQVQVAAGLSDRHVRPMPWDFFKENRKKMIQITELPDSGPIFDLVSKKKWLRWLAVSSGPESTPQANQAFVILGLLLRLNGLGKRPYDCPA